MGGWFSQSFIAFRIRLSITNIWYPVSEGWCVRPVWANNDYLFLLPQVRFTDNDGDRVTMPVKEFLELSQSSHKDRLETGWICCLHSILDEESNYQSSWQAAAEERDRRGVEIDNWFRKENEETLTPQSGVKAI